MVININTIANSPNINRARRRGLRSNIVRLQDPIIISSDSEEEERRINEEIKDIKREMKILDDKIREYRFKLAKKYSERESIRVSRKIKLNNLNLRREFETRLLPRLERVTEQRSEIINRSRVLFGNDNSERLPSYEELFPNQTQSTTSSNNSNENIQHSDSDSDLPSVDDIFNTIINNSNNN